VFTGVYQALRGIGRLPGVHIAAECGVNEGVNEEGIVRMVHRSPRTSYFYRRNYPNFWTYKFPELLFRKVTNLF
jgi:hypothetical protein